jgi:hypothetical protein
MSTRLFFTGAAMLAAAGLAFAYADGPPPSHTGGFGEQTCHACHFERELGEGAGELTVEGIPDAYGAGASYSLVVRLEHPGMEAAGFQLASRFASGLRAGQQAGELAALDTAVTVLSWGDPPVRYAQHTAPRMAEAGSSSWTIEWTAPNESGGRVVFHVAANAANGDASEFGDYVYADSLLVGIRDDYDQDHDHEREQD